MTIMYTSAVQLLVGLLLLPCFLAAQDCLPGGITFILQEDIDNFAANYPDCTTIEGNVTINAGPDGDISNLNGLATLTSIEGFLRIHSNPDLETLTGLDNLEAIGQALQIYVNPDLENLDGLEQLQTIGNELLLDRNEALVDIGGLSGLTSIGGDFRILDQLLLPNLTGLENLTGVGGTLLLIRNTALVNLMGLSNLESVGAVLSIVDNVSLPNLNGLENLLSVGGELTVNSNDQLLDLDGLQNLHSIGGNLHIMLNDVLTDITGVANIDPTAINILFIRFNPVLSACAVQSVCLFLDLPGSIAIISDNDSDNNGCNARAEVEEACDLLLPVVWANPLTVELGVEQAILQWSITQQIANDRFEIQHSTDGVSFHTIGQIPGETFAAAEQIYNYTHRQPAIGYNYYRIRQVDRDGAFSFSNLAAVHSALPSISIYPNPVTDYLYLRNEGAEAVHLTLANVTGQVLYQGAWTGAPIAFSTYPKGVYWLSMTVGKTQFTQRLIH